MRHLYYLNRKIDSKVMDALVLLICNHNLNDQNISKSEEFKEFILRSYSVPREERASVSQLSDMFKKYNCLKPGTLACSYAKALEEMAYKNNNQKFWV